MAGVVGTKMPHYCVFGEAVNIANKMEALGKRKLYKVLYCFHGNVFFLLYNILNLFWAQKRITPQMHTYLFCRYMYCIALSYISKFRSCVTSTCTHVTSEREKAVKWFWCLIMNPYNVGSSPVFLNFKTLSGLLK